MFQTGFPAIIRSSKLHIRKNLLKHVELLTEINKMWNVASCWLYSANILAMHRRRNIKCYPISVAEFIIKTVVSNFRLLWPCIMNVGRRERNQQDATNLIFIIRLISQHVSGIIMPIIRRTRVCTVAYGVLHLLWWLWLCGAGTRAVCTVKVTVRTVTFTVVSLLFRGIHCVTLHRH